MPRLFVGPAHFFNLFFSDRQCKHWVTLCTRFLTMSYSDGHPHCHPLILTGALTKAVCWLYLRHVLVPVSIQCWQRDGFILHPPEKLMFFRKIAIYSPRCYHKDYRYIFFFSCQLDLIANKLMMPPGLVNFSYLQFGENHIHNKVVSKSHSTKFASQTWLLVSEVGPDLKSPLSDFGLATFHFHLKLSFDGNWKLTPSFHNLGCSNVQTFTSSCEVMFHVNEL